MQKIALGSEPASPLRVIGGVDAGGQDIPVANVAKRLARERATRRRACGDGRYGSQFIRRQTAHRTSDDWTATRSAGALWPTLGDRQSATGRSLPVVDYR